MADAFKFLLLPIALLFGLAVYIRNRFYDWGFLKSFSFDFPIISVGNLSVGGTGKTPHVEYLIRLLSSHQFQVATLSRGYKRKTRGYILATTEHHADHIGDEPSLIKKKYPHVAVAVSESRSVAVPQILSEVPNTDVILLDDAFQHRGIEPGMSIVLTDYSHPFTRDFLLPFGTLREPRSAYHRADFIIVTKCPPDLSQQQRAAMIKEINPGKHQAVFFSYLKYYRPYNIVNNQDKLELTKDLHVFLFCGIARPENLEQHIRAQVGELWVKEFDDHHPFDRYDLEVLNEAFENIKEEKKVLMTTEKDLTRLFAHKETIIQKKLPIYAQPIQVEFFEQDKQLFEQEILNYLIRIKQQEQQINNG